jgi:hypothetical protein
MKAQITINETRGIIQFGEAIILGIPVSFCLNTISKKFTAIAYDEFKASGIFPEGSSKGVPQKYLVGQIILKSIY